MSQRIKRDFSDLDDKRLDSWIARLLEKGLSSDEQTKLALEERARRKSKTLKVEASIAHLVQSARERQFTTYGLLAKASNVEWNAARHLMNGAGGHLDTIVDICHVRGIPLLTAICVNQPSVQTGKLSEESLGGFINAAKRLGYAIADQESFLHECQQACFEWAASERSKEFG